MNIEAKGRLARIATRRRGVLVSRFLAVWLAGLFLLGSLLTVSRLPDASAQPRQSDCLLRAQRDLVPNPVPQGSTARVTISLQQDCPIHYSPVHIVFALDMSESMTDEAFDASRLFIRTLITMMDLQRVTRLGIVALSGDTEVRCELGATSTELVACLDGLEASGPSRLDEGIRESLELLRRGRPSTRGEVVAETLVIVSTGRFEPDCGPAIDETRAARREGVLLTSLCAGVDCDRACMIELASAARYAFGDDDPSGLGDVLAQLVADSRIQLWLRHLSFTEQLPENLRFPTGQDMPPNWDPTTRRLSWEQLFVPRTGITFSFDVLPLSVGRYPSSLDSRVVFTDTQNRQGEVSLPIAQIEVLPASLPIHLPYLLSGHHLDD